MIASRNLVFLAHSEPVTLHGLSYLINGHLGFHVCGVASTPLAAWDGCEAHQPDVAIIDPSLDCGGTKMIRELLRRSPRTRVVVFSGETDPLSVQRAFAAGAHGYATKRDQTSEVMLTVTRAFEGRRHMTPRVEHLLLEKLAEGAVTLNSCPESILSERELQVYKLMGMGKNRRDLAAELKVSAKTVETHQHRIKAKLHLRSAADLMREAALFCDTVTGTVR